MMFLVLTFKSTTRSGSYHSIDGDTTHTYHIVEQSILTFDFCIDILA